MLPKMTHLQCFIVHLVTRDEHSGRYLRQRLEEVGEKKSMAAFYQLMARIEEAGWVAGWYETEVVDGQTIKERRYTSTIEGRRQFHNAVTFYDSIRKNSQIDEILDIVLR